MAVNLKDIRLKVKFTKKKPDYENTTIGPPRTVDTSDKNQQEYEEVDVKAATTNEQPNHSNHNEYLDWDDRQKVKSNADTNKKLDKTETKKHVDDVQLPKAIQENTDKSVLKWKIISIIAIILCIGMASALIAITTLSDKGMFFKVILFASNFEIRLNIILMIREFSWIFPYVLCRQTTFKAKKKCRIQQTTRSLKLVFKSLQFKMSELRKTN